MGKSCITDARMRNVDKVLEGKHERSRPLGRLKGGWKDAIEIYFKEIIWKGLYWVCLP
jgi:hypothetical protein